ncbi:MAG: hypothetical protein N3A66_04225, partial [Planctomycetota bacterium]|nr:hypothetical protein [Planctomycetota bacterium]
MRRTRRDRFFAACRRSGDRLLPPTCLKFTIASMSTITVNFRLQLGWMAAWALGALAAAAAEGTAWRLGPARRDHSPLLAAVLAPPRLFAERAERFRELLCRGGATPAEIAEETLRRSSGGSRNLSVVLPGREPAAGALLFGAHLDAHAQSPGAIDNWSGAVMLASLHA